jgi:hypothetical protein
MMETATTAPRSTLAQIATTCSARTGPVRSPEGPSIFRTTAGGSMPGTRAPTSIQVPTGSVQVAGRDSGPSETTPRSVTTPGSALWNGWVSRHRWQRATPTSRRSVEPGPRWRMRWGVSSPQVSQGSVAACTAGSFRPRWGAAGFDGASGPSSGSPILAPGPPYPSARN